MSTMIVEIWQTLDWLDVLWGGVLTLSTLFLIVLLYTRKVGTHSIHAQDLSMEKDSRFGIPIRSN